MKITAIYFCFFCYTAVFAQPESGTIGDVKYSILHPDKFVEKNGSGWVIMMGQRIEGSDLHLFTGMVKLPDARGNFIRSMNLGRVDNGDMDGDRLVGSYQADMIKEHQHKYQKPNGYAAHSQCGNCGGSFAGGFSNVDSKQQPSGGKETRPRNITLYTYIKINE